MWNLKATGGEGQNQFTYILLLHSEQQGDDMNNFRHLNVECITEYKSCTFSF